MKNLALTFIALIAVVTLAACGGGDYQAPPKANKKPTSTGGGGTGGEAPKGQSYANEFRTESDAALNAWKTWSGDKTPENYAKVGEHVYNALRYKIMHTRNGHSESGLHRSSELKRLYTDWRKTFQTGDWESNEDYKASFKAYQDVQQES